MFGFTLLPVAIQITFLLLVYRMETPKYLLEQGKEEECRKVLEYIYKEEYVEEVLLQKKKDLGLEQDDDEDAPAGKDRVTK